jgi:hypothetical protein
MLANLFKRAEASVDNAIGDLGNRVVIAIPFLIAMGFAASSLSIALNNAYGAEIGNLLVAGTFCGFGLLVAVVVKLRSRPTVTDATTPADAPNQEAESKLGASQSILDDETLMAVVSSAAPIVLPALIRTGLKNWQLLFAIAAGLYVFSRPDQTTPDVQST